MKKKIIILIVTIVALCLFSYHQIKSETSLFFGAKILRENEITDIEKLSNFNLEDSLLFNGKEVPFNTTNNCFLVSQSMETNDYTGKLSLNGYSIAYIKQESLNKMESLSSGYKHKFIIYNDTSYSYINVQFSGLPIIVLETESVDGVRSNANHYGKMTIFDPAGDGRGVIYCSF